MILLLGGTSDTAGIADSLAASGLDVLVSTASDTPLDVGRHPQIARRSGPLDGPALEALIVQRDIGVVVDATHPYAEQIRATARSAANATGRPYLTYVRPPSLAADDNVILAENHESAANTAFALGCPVLLTCGASNLLPYVQQSRATGMGLFARVLDRDQSLQACRQAGLEREHILLGRGPFDVDTNRQHIRYCHAGVIVTKDGGEPSGLRAKLEAAQLEDCRVVVVARPSLPADGIYKDVHTLVHAVRLAVAQRSAQARETDESKVGNE